MPTAYFNGQFVDKDSIAVSAADFGFVRGVTIFELTRVYGGRPFRLDDHLERFAQGAKGFGIRCPLSRGEIVNTIKTIIAKNAYLHSAVKLYLTAGECGIHGAVSFAGCDQFTPHLMIIEDEVKPLHPDVPKGVELHQRGISLKTVLFSRQLPAFKTINYAPGFHAVREVAAEGWDEILFTHAGGYVTETTMSNFFAVIDGALCTPVHGMLFGVTRKVLLELAKKIGVPVRECDITIADLARATEAFITGSIMEMMPVKKIDAVIFSATMDGPVFKRLRQAFSAYIKDYK